MWIADDLLYILGFGEWVILLYQTMAGQNFKKSAAIGRKNIYNGEKIVFSSTMIKINRYSEEL